MKRLIVLFLTLVMMATTAVCTPALAASTLSVPYEPVSAEDIVYPQGSLTLSSYGATAKTADDGSGGFFVSFTVTSSLMADEVGASKIEVYKSDGTLYCFMEGVVGGTLIAANSGTHAATQLFMVDSGTYYAKVYVYATKGTLSDSRIITTSSVKVP